MKTRFAFLMIALALSSVACATDDGGPDTTGAPATHGTAPADWVRGSFFVDRADVVVMESFPIQVRLEVAGEVPTPCHVPVWEIDDDGSTISVTLESAADPDVVCAQVLEPVEVNIPLGSFSEGSRQVTLNGEVVGSFSA